MKRPQPLKVNRQELIDLRERAKAKELREEDAELIEALAETVVVLSDAVQTKSTGIRRLLRLLFGTKTEKKKNLFDGDNDPDKDPPTGGGTGSEGGGAAGSKPKKKPPGHGRNSADTYTGAERFKIPHPDLQVGQTCPACQRGRLYSQKPSKLVHIQAQMPFTATVHECERLRCSGCGKVFTAPAPGGVAQGKYHRNVGVMIALLKYGAGMPFNRLEMLQKAAGIPFPASVQWEQVAQTAEPLWGILEELRRLAASGEVLHNDDTRMKILEFIQTSNPDPESKNQRRAINTTGIISLVGPWRVALFRTGPRHAGENLEQLLDYRPEDASPPIQMCDGLSLNKPGAFHVLMANCLVHARRKFVDEIENFPEQSKHVIELMGEIYENDNRSKEASMSSDQRLLYHQEMSAPITEELHSWCHQQLDEHLIEPNSGLGQAISYLLRHWTSLTLFLREPGAPLDNNLCERALKKAILHRKNSMFFKTQFGAQVGDLFMSLIHTCQLNSINAFHYLITLAEQTHRLKDAPQQWLPWNYSHTLEQIQPSG